MAPEFGQTSQSRTHPLNLRSLDMLIILLILILVFGGGFGYHRYGYSRYGNRGYGLLGIIVLVLLLYWLFGAGGLGGFHNS
jgi:hypothetical protein